MSFTEEEKALWHAARRAGINPADFHLHDLKDELEQVGLAETDDEEEGLGSSSVCAHCGHSLGETSYSDFPLCNACDD